MVAHALTHARAELPPPTRAGDEVRAAARGVLARPEYHRHDPNAFQRAQQALADFVGRLLNDAVRGPGIVGLILFALVLAVIVVASVRFTRQVTHEGAVPSTGSAVTRKTASDWRADGVARERAGDWRGALRCRYRALVADLAERGVVEDVPGRTAGEYRREVAGAVPDAAGDFAGATELFEQSWYGHASTDAADALRFDELAGRVLTGAGR